MSFSKHRTALASAISLVVVSTFQAVAAAQSPVIMGMEGMTALHQGLFRGGANTFQYGSGFFEAGSLGRYHSFYVVDNDDTTGVGLTHNGRMNSTTPASFISTDYVNVTGIDLGANYFPIIDRAAFGAVFDPDEYELEVVFKPILAGGAIPIVNEATSFSIVMEQGDGYVYDEASGIHKRAGEQLLYNVGSEETPVNTWYASAAKDANGFATWTAPMNAPTFAQRGYYYAFGDNTFRTDHTVAGGGTMFDTETSQYVDVTDGADFDSFGSPLSTLNVPNGLNTIGVSSAFDSTSPNINRDLSIEVQSIRVKKINPVPGLVVRMDGKSGITHRFGGALSYPNTLSEGDIPTVNVPGDSFPYKPPATDQISRFNQSGMTNLIINARTPTDPNENYQFILRGPPLSQTFDGTQASVQLRAKLTQSIGAGIADNLRVLVKDLDGNDLAAGQGGEEYYFDFDLNQLNTSTFTTLSVPLPQFTRTALANSFTNEGDGLLTDFNLYELTGMVLGGDGLLKLEIEYLQVTVPAGIEGDFDQNGKVDGNDFLLWQRGGSPNPHSPTDLAAWKANYGMSSSAPVAQAVPEPAAALLAGLGMIGLMVRRKGL